MLPSLADRPDNGPWPSVHHDFRANKPSREQFNNASPLLVVRKSVFTQAIPQDPAEQSLACSVATPGITTEIG
jgi:hypothetical protein